MSINSITGNTLLTSGSFPPVRAASTGSPLNPATGGLLMVDGVRLIAGDRVLCKDEASAINNGIYAASTGPWVRTSDAAGNQNFFSGMAITVALGAINAGLTFICTTTDDPVVIGTSLISFAAQSIVATATQSATSATSFTIGTGSKTFTIQAGKAFQVNQWVIIQETSNSANQMLGQITAYSGTSMTVNVIATGGAGTHADWTIALTNSPAAAGYQPPVGFGNVTGPGSSTAGHMATFVDASGKVVQDGGMPIGGANSILPSMFASAAISLGATLLNGIVVPSVTSNTLTFAIKTLGGGDPSPSDPVFFVFRSATPGSGAYSVIEVTAALSTTVPAGNTLGFANGVPGRVWLVAVNNSGTVSLAIINCLTQTSGVPNAIFPLAGFAINNVTAYSSGANSAGLLYGASSLSNVPYGVLGFATWEPGNTLATAGQWSVGPSRTELYRPGVPLPGTPLQQSLTLFGTNTTNATGTPTNSVVSAQIVPTSSANVIDIYAQGLLTNSADTDGGLIRLVRGSTPIGMGNCQVIAPAASGGASIPISWLDFPGSLGTQTFTVQVWTSVGGTAGFPNNNGIMTLKEIQA
jgi:hypothetical protein